MTTAADIVDSQGMLAAAAAMPEQVATAALAARDLDKLPDRDSIEHVVVLGMGGSGMAGDVLLAAAGPYLPVPIIVIKNYTLPAFVGESSLVFSVSFSGDTEETVEATTEAAVQGARIVCIAGGGELAHLASAWDAPLVSVPPGIPQPRAGLAALAIPALVVLEEMGLFPGASHWIRAAVDQLAVRRDRLMQPGAESEELARSIGRMIPLFHGSGLGAVAAQRWKTQMNENAKTPAFWNAQPELCHNEIAGWGQHGDLTRQAISLVTLRHDFEHPQVMHRFDFVAGMIDEVVGGIHEVRAEGDGELAQLLDLILVGDFTSVHRAIQEGVDPGPIPVIADLKRALAGSRPSEADGST